MADDEMNIQIAEKTLIAGTRMPKNRMNKIGSRVCLTIAVTLLESTQKGLKLAKLLSARLLSPKQLKGMLSAKVGCEGKLRVAVVSAEK